MKSYFRAGQQKFRPMPVAFSNKQHSCLRAAKVRGLLERVLLRKCRAIPASNLGAATDLMNLYTPEVGNPRASAQLTRETPEACVNVNNSLDSRDRMKHLLIIGFLVAVVIAMGLGLWSLSARLTPKLVSSQGSGEDDGLIFLPEKSIAILPFENLSGDDENAFLASGVPGEILTTLSKVADLKVISSTSVNSYVSGTPRNLREIAETLGVAYVLEGTVRQIGGKIQITAQLTDARTATPVWAENYERDLGDVFAIQGDIVQRILSQLRVTVSPEEKTAIAEKPTQDLAAYGFYVRAKALIASISISAKINEKLREAVQLLDQAIARDPGFYPAYCELSAANDYLYFFGMDHSPARLASADAALKAIVRLRPDAPETHLARADFLYRCYLDYDRARAELALVERALPNNSEIFELSGYMDRRQGLWDESARSLQRALGLDPRNFLILQQIALSYQEFGKFAPMAAALDRALVLAPGDLDTRVTRALVDLEWKADPRSLHEIVREILAEDPATAPDLADQWFYVALCERDPAAARQALAVMPASGTAVDLNFPRSWCEGLAARARGDNAAAYAAFLAARAELQKVVTEQPNYGPGFGVLGLTDAALGRKEEALREGRRAVELLPVTKDAIDGAELVKYLGVIYAWCGEKDLAIQQITTTLRIPSTLSYGNLKLHPCWDPLRGDPRFEKIVADLAPKKPQL